MIGIIVPGIASTQYLTALFVEYMGYFKAGEGLLQHALLWATLAFSITVALVGHVLGVMYVIDLPPAFVSSDECLTSSQVGVRVRHWRILPPLHLAPQRLCARSWNSVVSETRDIDSQLPHRPICSSPRRE